MKSRKLSKDEIRSSLLAIMVEIDRVAKLLGLNYFLYAGTLLGAVRHKGFIPWDDDVDLCIPRCDFEKLVSLFNIYADKRYRLIYFTNTKNYVWSIAKVIDTHTYLKEYTLNPHCEYGLYVDLFALDYVDFNSEEENREYERRIINFNRAQMITNFRFAPNVRKFYNLWIMLHYKGGHRFRYLFADPVENLKEWDSYVRSFSKEEKTKKMLPVFITIPPYRLIQQKFDSEWFSATVPVEFEGVSFPAPKGYDELLRFLYRDYMQLPPEKERKGDHFKSVVWRKGRGNEAL